MKQTLQKIMPMNLEAIVYLSLVCLFVGSSRLYFHLGRQWEADGGSTVTRLLLGLPHWIFWLVIILYWNKRLFPRETIPNTRLFSIVAVVGFAGLIMWGSSMQ